MKKILPLRALATAAALAADQPFPWLKEVTDIAYAEVANRIEYQNLVLLPAYTVVARHYYLAPNHSWITYAKQGDRAAHAWHGRRQAVSGRKVGIDLIELWADRDNLTAAALVISEAPVDNQGNYLLAWLELLPTQVRQDRSATLRIMTQALRQGDSARLAALMHVPDDVIHKTAWREALQPCLHAHLPQIRASHPQRRGIKIRMNVDGKKRSITLPLQKDDDGYAFVLDTAAFSQCQNLPL